MFEHQERTAFLILIGVAVAVIGAHLVLGTLGKQPFARTFTNNSADGELVVTEGTVDQISIMTGGHITVKMENLSVFVPVQVAEGLLIQKGDSIRVYGIVQTYHGKKEIILGSKDDIRVVTGQSGKK
jgi:DNA/RNA endonuclease YhcR with UshA esterase domain